jgi:hypothetical protein
MEFPALCTPAAKLSPIIAGTDVGLNRQPETTCSLYRERRRAVSVTSTVTASVNFI